LSGFLLLKNRFYGAAPAAAMNPVTQSWRKLSAANASSQNPFGCQKSRPRMMVMISHNPKRAEIRYPVIPKAG